MSKSEVTVSVIGAGYVGLTTAVLLAEAGYTTYIIDINQARLQKIKEGRSFFYEDGIDPLIAHAVENKKLIPTDSYDESIPHSQVVFSCVGTPDNPDGSSNLTYVFSAAEQAGKLLKPGAVFVQKSTVPVGTGARVEETFVKLKKNVAYVSNPEFLREGTAISDTLYFDRIVAGGNDKKAVEQVMDLYKTIERHRDKITERAGLKVPEHQKGQYITTNRNSAELIKVTANAFLALKISFANSIAKLSDHTDADVLEVMDAVGADRRIGRAFLNAGRGYGGGCFPKDVSGLIASANEHGVELPIMTAASDVNDSMPGYIAEKAQVALGGSLPGKKVAVLGLAFKAGTSDVRRSPGVHIANLLVKNGAAVSAYDPQANQEAREDLHQKVSLYENWQDAVKDTDAIFITTEWPEFSKVGAKELRKLMDGTVVVDAMNMLDKNSIREAGLTYIGVGRS